MKQCELVDGLAVQNLRQLYKLQRTQVARMCQLSEEQVQELEEGGQKSFETPALKMQAALKLARTLSGERSDGMPYANVFKGRGHQSHASNQLQFPTLTPVKYTYRTNPADLVTVAAIVLFVFLIVAIPVMRMGNPVHQKGDFLVPKTWKP